MTTLHNRIGKERAPAAVGRSFEVTNPADGSRVATAPRSGRADVERAVACAREAFGAWKSLPAPARGEIMLRAGRVLTDRKEALAKDMAREMGKRLEEARGDVQEA